MVAKNLKNGKEYFGNLKNMCVLSLVVVGIVLMLSGSVNAYSGGGGICYCGNANTTLGGSATDACVDCSAALNDNTRCANQVNYVGTVPINNRTETCINNPVNFNNKIFDCQGNTIDGDDIGDNYGIYLYSNQNNNIKNCIITGFAEGIRLDYSTNNILTNNTANNNTNYGIYIYFSSNNTLTNNTANNNSRGIHLSYSSSNTLSNNTVKENHRFDIDMDIDIDIWTNSDAHCNNLIENNTGSGDKPIKYFNHSVNLQNEILSELILCNTDNSNINNVTIAGSPTVKNNGLIIYRTEKSNFKNINSSDNFKGISLYSSSNNTITNNTANNNSYGINFGYGSNNNTMIANNMCYNSEYDVYNGGNSNSTTGDNNTCVISYNYNDANSNGCKYVCSIDGCNCSSCGECSYKLSHPSCSQVNLTANIVNQSGNCINNPLNFNNKIFDCQGHVIAAGICKGHYIGQGEDYYIVQGEGQGYDTDCYKSNGIYLSNKQNNTIRNCIITNFSYGISLYSSSNNTLANNTANNNGGGLHMCDSANNSVIQNTFCFNFGFKMGITSDIHNSIYPINGTNYGINNTCDTTFNHNDTNAAGCKNKCPYVPFAPFIQKKWEIPDDNNSVYGTQIYIALDEVKVTKCAIVCDHNGVSDINKVMAYVYYPNNAFMEYEILENATNESICRQIGYNQTFCNVYEGNLTLTRFYPTGNYTVIVVANDSTNLKANMTNKFELIDVCGYDTDGDGIGDACDNCKNVNNSDQNDTDGDVIGDVCDNCKYISNTNQADSDKDGAGDACDNDADNDGINNSNDNCWKNYNPDQNDSDQDGIGNVCDNCLNVSNYDQADPDNDNLGSICDNCPKVHNTDQKDNDSDGTGDACEEPPKVWSANVFGEEKDGFYSGQNVYVSGQRLPPNTQVDIYIRYPDKNSGWANGESLANFYMDSSGIDDATTDASGNLSTTLIWPNLPSWRTLPSPTTSFDIVVDVNRNGKWEPTDVVDSLHTYGFLVDPIWASDVSGAEKQTYSINEIVYVNGTGLPVNNTNITIYIVHDYNKWNNRLGLSFISWNVTSPINATLDVNGNFVSIVSAWNNLVVGDYDVIADLNNDGVIQENEIDGMDDRFTTGFTVVKCKEPNDVFDAVEMLEYLSGDKESSTPCWDLNNDHTINLLDVLALINKIGTK